jgi:hypothetical protein
MSSRVRIPCTFPRSSVIGNSCWEVRSKASAASFSVALERQRLKLRHHRCGDAQIV